MKNRITRAQYAAVQIVKPAVPLVLVDIGAAGGVPDRWRSLGRSLSVVAFEPNRDAAEKLIRAYSGSGPCKVFNSGLSNQSGDVRLYITRDPRQSSLLPPNRDLLNDFPESQRFDVVDTATVSVDSLDHQLAINGVVDVDFIKVDTQGTELAILKGGSDTIRGKVFGLEVEVEFVEMYKHQPLFTDVFSLLTSWGFSLIDIRSDYWKRKGGEKLGGPKGQIIWADTLWFRDPRRFSTDTWIAQSSETRILKALAICFLYGYADYALELFREAQSNGLLGAENTKIINEMISRCTVWSPHFLWKMRLSRLFFWLARTLCRDRNSWGYVELGIGNY